MADSPWATSSAYMGATWVARFGLVVGVEGRIYGRETYQLANGACFLQS